MNNKLIDWIIFIVLCFIWGSSFIIMKFSKAGLSAWQIAALRIFSAGVVFLPFAVFHIQKINRKKIPVVILAGVFGNLVPAFLFAAAISNNLDSSLAGILNSLTPLCVVLIGISFFKDKIKKQKIQGVVVGFAGVVLLTLTRSGGIVQVDNLNYALVILLATILYGVNVNLYSHFMKEQNPVHVATVSLAFMAIPAGIVLWYQGFFSLNFNNTVIREAVIYSSLLGIVASAIATVLFYILVKRAGGLFASLVTYGIPFVALFLGFLDSETIDLTEIGCLGIILSGVYLANRN
jgi:drug/metabolite transporter (DMT)-like permease